MPGSRRRLPSSPPTVTRRTILAAGLGGVFAAACAAPSGEPPGRVAIHGDNAGWADPLSAAGGAMKSAVGIDLVPKVIPSLESFEQVVKSSLRTHKTPDLLKYWSGYRLQDLARTGGIVDLSDTWQAAERRGWVEPSLREAFAYRDRVYGLPMNLAYWVFFYNTEVFADQGLSAPRDWAAFLEVCARLKDAGITPLHATTDGRWPAFIWFQEVLSRQDPQFYQDLMNGRESYTDPRAERALQTIAEFFDNDWFTALDMNHVDASAAVVHGSLGMMPGGTWLTPNLVAAGGEPGRNIDAFVLPMAEPGTRPAVIFESSALVCTVKGPDRAEATEAAAAWLRPEVAAAFAGALQDGSPNPGVEPANPMLAGIEETVRDGELWLLNRFWEQGPPELCEATVDDLAGFLLNPSSYRSVLRTMQGRAEDAWQVWREAEI